MLDTSIGVKKSLNYTIEQMRLPHLLDEELQTFIGPPIYQSLKEKFHLSEEETLKGVEIFRNVYKDKFLFEAVVYPNLFHLLHFLRGREVLIGVATYKREDYTLKLLDHFGIRQLCDDIIGADFENRMTKTDIILKCIENLGITDLKETVLIGDTTNDAIGAANCGIDFIGVMYGFGFKNKKELEKYPHVGCIDNLIEIAGQFS